MEATTKADRACFDGMFLSALTFGALVMLYIQLTQVLLRKPKRGRVFWGIVAYSSLLAPLATVAFVGKFKLAEVIYVAERNTPHPQAIAIANSKQWFSVMSAVCTTLLGWLGDWIMIYRIVVLWNKWWLAIPPGCIYLARVAVSIPFLLAETGRLDMHQYPKFANIFYALCVGVNIMFTVLISIRLITMRHKAERVLGRVQASLYNSTITIFVESGAFFTLWAITYLILRTRNSWVQDAFQQPYIYVLALTRMLIVLRIAQDRAWSRDIITAADAGVLDWQVSSSNSIALHTVADDHPQMKDLPKKFREDFLS